MKSKTTRKYQCSAVKYPYNQVINQYLSCPGLILIWHWVKFKS